MWLLSDLKGDGVQAYDWFEKYQMQTRAAPEKIEAYRNAYRKADWKEILREQIRRDEKNITPDNAAVLYYEMACFHARLGNRDEAFKFLDKAYEQRSFGLIMIKADPFLDSLHDDPRFKELVKRIGLK